MSTRHCTAAENKSNRNSCRTLNLRWHTSPQVLVLSMIHGAVPFLRCSAGLLRNVAEYWVIQHHSGSEMDAKTKGLSCRSGCLYHNPTSIVKVNLCCIPNKYSRKWVVIFRRIGTFHNSDAHWCFQLYGSKILASLYVMQSASLQTGARHG